MTMQNSRVRESTNLSCPECGTKQRTKGWLLWHLSKYHPKYICIDPSPAPASEVEGPNDEIKLRQEAIAKRGAVVWECKGCGKLTYDVGVTKDTPGLEVRKITYCIRCIRGW